MSSTVIPGPDIWRQRAQKSLVVVDEARAADSVHVEVGGGGPYDPTMEVRMTAMEADLKEIKGVLGRLEPLLGKMDDRLRKMETDTLPKLGSEIAELKGRVSQLPSTIQLIGFVLAVLVIAGFTRYFVP